MFHNGFFINSDSLYLQSLLPQLNSNVHSMDEHKRHEMDKMDDMFRMQYSISVEN